MVKAAAPAVREVYRNVHTTRNQAPAGRKVYKNIYKRKHRNCPNHSNSNNSGSYFDLKFRVFCGIMLSIQKG